MYEAPSSKDGVWLLVDRLWPRGLKKEEVPFDAWPKEITPSAELRKWFDHEPEKWVEFANCYVDELKDKPEFIEEILDKAKDSSITLFYAAKDKRYNHARVLKKILECWPDWPEFNE